MSESLQVGGNRPTQSARDHQGHQPEKSEERVDECPEELDLSNDDEDHGVWHEEDAREDAEIYDPPIPRLISDWPKQGDGEYEMAVCQPICAVGHERIGGKGPVEGDMDMGYPLRHGWPNGLER